MSHKTPLLAVQLLVSFGEEIEFSTALPYFIPRRFSEFRTMLLTKLFLTVTICALSLLYTVLIASGSVMLLLRVSRQPMIEMHLHFIWAYADNMPEFSMKRGYYFVCLAIPRQTGYPDAGQRGGERTRDTSQWG